MPKNIVVCCDGTANEFAKDNTNVVKLYSTLVHDSPAQCTYYHPGVGTMEPAGALTPLRRRLTKALGLAFGAYLENDIRDAYAFIMQSFEPGDRLFLFGFSRGAYTVRAVASLLYNYGLLRRGNETMIPYAVRTMMGIQEARRRDRDDAKIAAYFRLAQEFKQTLSRECKPWFVGVWDTVSSVGWIENPVRLPNSADNPDIEFGRHAIAIDERRAFFRTNLWRRNSAQPEHGPKNEKQVWFAGVHCDVGGGYPEGESGLSKLALEWMLDEATAPEAGLLVDHARRDRILGLSADGGFIAPDPSADPHESLRGLWRLAEFVPKRHFDIKTHREERRMNLFRRRTIPDGSMIHWSVFERSPKYVERLPERRTIFPQPPHAARRALNDPRGGRTRPICASRYWNDTGISLTAGRRYRATVVPNLGEPLMDASFHARTIAGEDWQSVPHKSAQLLYGKRLDSAKWFALIGTVDQKAPWVMSDGAEFIAPADGRLMCYFNDVQLEIFYRNNSGWVVLDLEPVS